MSCPTSNACKSIANSVFIWVTVLVYKFMNMESTCQFIIGENYKIAAHLYYSFSVIYYGHIVYIFSLQIFDTVLFSSLSKVLYNCLHVPVLGVVYLLTIFLCRLIVFSMEIIELLTTWCELSSIAFILLNLITANSIPILKYVQR